VDGETAAKCPDATRRMNTYDLSSRNFGSHWSPGSATSWDGAAVCSAAAGDTAEPRPAAMASGKGGGRGAGPLAGVLIRLTSWLPGGFGGGAGGVCAYIFFYVCVLSINC
jgi:hypothetical protein